MALCAPWASAEDLCAPCFGNYTLDDATLDNYILQASELLYRLSGQQFPGVCSITVTPCSDDCVPGPTQFEPFMSRSLPLRGLHPNNPFPWSGCACGSQSCRCGNADSVRLPHDDIIAITEVSTTDDGVLDAASYTYEAPYLIRLDDVRWPNCDNDFTVSYTYGAEPPASGVQAVGVLACELILACDPTAVPDGKCRLPRNISSISRQGVSVIFDRLTNAGPFRFGIWEIDTFLEAYNPYGITGPSHIASPDTINIARRVP